MAARRALPAWLLLAAVMAGGCGAPTDQDAFRARARMPLAAVTPVAIRPPGLPAAPPGDPQVRRLLEQAAERMAAQRPDEAVALLADAAAREPDNAVVRRELGLACMGADDLAAAREHLLIADGDDPSVQMALGRIAEQSGRLDEANLRYRTALECTIDDDRDALMADQARLMLTRVLYEQGYLAAALDVLAALESHLYERDYSTAGHALSALAYRPEQLALQRARILLELKRYADAADVADAAWRLNKSDPAAAGVLAAALAGAGRGDRADAVCLEILAGPLQPHHVLNAILAAYDGAGDTGAPRRLLGRYQARHGAPPATTLALLAWATRALGDTGGAVDLLAANVDAVTDRTSPALTLADWLAEQGRPDEAVEVLARLLMHDPQARHRVRSRLGRTPRAYLDPDRIGRLADAAMNDSSPSGPLRLLVTGLMLERCGRPGMAVVHYRLATEAAPTLRGAYEALAARWLADKEYGAVGALADRAEAAGDPVTAECLRGMVDLLSGRRDEGLRRLTAVTEAEPAHIPAQLWLTRAFMNANRLEEAHLHLQDVLDLQPNDEALELLFHLGALRIRQAQQQGRTDEAREVATQVGQAIAAAIRQDPANPQMWTLLAMAQVQEGHYRLAGDTVQRLLSLAPNLTGTRVIKARVEARLPAEAVGPRRFARAIVDLDVAAQSSPENADAWMVRGQLLTAAGRHGQAADAYRRGRELRPGDDIRPLVEALRLSGRFAEAAEALAPTAADSPLSQVLYVDSLLRAGQADRAVQWLEGAPAPNPVVTQAALVHALAAAGRAGEAAERAQQWAGQDGDGGQALLRDATRLSALGLAGRHEELQTAAGERFDARPASDWAGAPGRYTDLFLALGAAGLTPGQQQQWGPVTLATNPVELAAGWLIVAGRLDEASALMRDRIDRLASGGEGQAGLASSMRCQWIRQLAVARQDDRVRALYPALVAEDGGNAPLLALASLVYNRGTAEDDRIAEGLLSRALALSPDDPNIQNNLAYLWADRGENLDRAEQLLSQAVTADPQPHIQDSWAWVRYKKGEFRPALAMLLEALDSAEGNDPTLYDHTGDTLWRLDRPDDAVAMWAEAEDLAAAMAERSPWDAERQSNRDIAENASAKIKAVRNGRRPNVAPLGIGVRP
ncbi:MAG: tetratricopeptide repeat protein [Planctomycetes bacterium]|nr:tetratricopeptide repeat protein [Planctomycetota bacterium]